jgi:lipoate---protein ligase
MGFDPLSSSSAILARPLALVGQVARAVDPSHHQPLCEPAMTDDLPIDPYAEEDAQIAATRDDGQRRVRVYRLPRTVVVLGRGSKPEREVDLDACRRDRVLLQRRRGGGCAVVVDPGNVIVAVTLPVAGIGRNLQHFDHLTRWLAAALARLGAPPIVRQGSSDLTIAERKVGGACIYRGKDLLHYAATLLITPELALIERYLRHPPREPDYRRGRSHADFLVALGGDAARLEGALRGELRLDDLPADHPAR